MNKVFKVIWSEARNAYVVVSEMAKSHGTKSCSTKKMLAMLIATGVMTCSAMGFAADKNTTQSDYRLIANLAASNGVYMVTTDGITLKVKDNATGDVKDVKINNVAQKKFEMHYVSINDDIADNKNNDGAKSKYAIAIGGGALVKGQAGVAVGKSAKVEGVNGIAIGNNSQSGYRGYGVAVGGNTQAFGTYSVALGQGANVLEYEGIAIGHGSISNQSNAIAIGTETEATVPNSVAFSNGAKASKWGSIAFGSSSVSDANGSVAVGSSSEAHGANSIAIGNQAVKSKENSVVIGGYTYKGTTGTGVGQQTQVLGNYSAAFGMAAKANVERATAIGSRFCCTWCRFYCKQRSWLSRLYPLTGGKSANTIFAWKSTKGDVSVGGVGVTRQIINVAAGSEDTYAVNVAQLKKVGELATATKTEIKKGDNIASIDAKTAKDGHTIYTINAKGTKVSGDANFVINSVEEKGNVTNYKLKLADTVKIGERNPVQINGTAGTITGLTNTTVDYNGFATTGKAATEEQLKAVKNELIASDKDTHIDNSKEYNVENNQIKLDVLDKDGKKLEKQVVIKDVAKASDVGDISELKEGVLNKDCSKTTVVDAINNIDTRVGNVEKKVDDIGAIAKAHNIVSNTDKNITVDSSKKTKDGGTIFDVNLNKDKLDLNKVIIEGNKGKVTAIDVEATAVTAGQTSINNEGLAVGSNTSLKADELKVDGKTYIDKNGLNANGMKITNVADGKENSDAVNVGQLKESEKTINNRIDGVENQVVNNTNRINKLGSRVNKVGAGAAALAALHPMDFDPDDKLTFSAGYGNYAGENAAAIGAYYRPDEKVMFSVAGTVGNGENMVNAGVSFALDRTNHVSNSRTALAREVIDLRGQLAVMGAKMEKAFGMLNETKTKLFPDVPANHWAYEYIAKLAGNGYIEGYPDGNFGGDRLMTRYEFAAMLYRAIENGAALEEKIIKEFEPELGRIRVDRISGEDGDRDKIERVRVNDTKGERDHYGNKLAK